MRRMKTAWLGWALAIIATGVSWKLYGSAGVALAVTLIAFWLLLQFSRAVRVLRRAADAPVGHVASAVMLHSKLREGLRLTEVITLAGSLGRKLAEVPETFGWADASGASVRIEFKDGCCERWTLLRDGTPASPAS
jgi:uncharacterized protein (DUF58 family)